MFDSLKKRSLNSRLSFQLGLLLIITTASYFFPHLFYLNYILFLNIIFLLTETLELNFPKHLFTNHLVNKNHQTYYKFTKPINITDLNMYADTQTKAYTHNSKTDLAFKKFEQNIYNIISSCMKNPYSFPSLFANLSDKSFILVIYKTSFSMCTDDINLGRFLMNICNSKYQFFEEQVSPFIEFKNGEWWFSDELIEAAGDNTTMRVFFEVIKSFDSAPEWIIKKLRVLIE